MKKELLGIILSLMALLPSTMQAAVSGDRIFIPNRHAYATEAWTMAWTTSGSVSTCAMAVSNGVVYGPLAAASSSGSTGLVYYNSFYYETNTSSLGVVNTGATGNGHGIATDDNKNLLVAYGPGESEAHKTFRIYKAASKRGEIIDPANYKDITVHIYSVGYCRYFSASGNLWDGTGYIYMTDGQKAVRVTINASGTSNGASISDNYIGHAVTLPSGIYSSTDLTNDYIKPLYNGRYMLSLQSGDYTTDAPLTILDVEIDWAAGTITVPDDYKASYWQMPDVAEFKGHELYAHPYGTKNYTSSTGTYHTVTDMNGNDVKFPVAVVLDRSGTYSQTVTSQPYDKTGNYGCFASVNAWCCFEQIDDNTMGLYMLSPYNGNGSCNEIMRYDISYETYSGEVVVNTSDAPNRQDAVLSWSGFNHPCSGYKVEYNTNYTNASGTQTTSYVTLQENTTDTTATKQDIYWILSKSKRFERTYNFRITPLKEDGTALGHPLEMSLTPEFLVIPAPWATPATVNYPGYQKCQLFWETSSYGAYSGSQFNVYRDGVKVNAAPIIGYNYLDTEIPTGEHTYRIETIYPAYTSSTIFNTPQTVTIGQRDPMKTTYSIETIYNHRIGSGDGEVKPQGIYGNLLNRVRYKQGVYYKGNWYLSQQYDANTSQENFDNNTTAYGGVMRFPASSAALINEAAGRFIRFDIKSAYQDTITTSGPNVGIAMDEGGNIFLRGGGSSGLNGDMLNGESDKRKSLVFELGYGLIYLRNSDGSYNDPITVDLSKCQLSDSYGRDPVHGTYFARTDYFNMTGDLSSVGGEAYLWISGSSTYRSNKIKLTRTSSGITATLIEKVDIPTDMIQVSQKYSGVENYVFPVRYLKKNDDGTYSHEYRGDYVHQLRSRLYANVKPTNNPDDDTDELLSIYNTSSRINNAGGCTIGWNGEVFLITPQCTYSQNSGNFLVSMGDRTDYTATASTDDESGMLDSYYADLSNPIPAAQLTQDEITDGSYNDANGNWIYAVHGKIEGEQEIGLTEGFTDPGTATCVYIYQYIPGVRFAKYRLISNNYFPATPVDLAISSVYGETRYRADDLVGYEGTAKFGIALETAETTIGNVNYKIANYTYVFKDAAGTDVWTYTVNTDGSYTYTRVKDGETTTGSGTGTLVNDIYTDINGTEHSAYFEFTHPDLKRDVTYQSTVTVNYVNTTDTTDTHTSETTIDEDKRTYTPVAADPESVTVYTGQTGTSVEGIYRVEIDFDPPQSELEEPVSYYQIIVKKPMTDGSTVTDTIKGFELMVDGSPDWNSGKYHDYIPGNYDFQNNEGTWSEGSETSQGKSTLIYYHKATDGETDPSKWTYSIEAVYGATNANVATEASADVKSEIQDGGVTAIETVEAGAQSLRLYPVPVASALTVEAAETIGTVNVYNISGTTVMTADGNGDCSTTLDVSHLAPGYYLLEINHSTIVRFIKK